jgi:hypothetical protein
MLIQHISYITSASILVRTIDFWIRILGRSACDLNILLVSHASCGRSWSRLELFCTRLGIKYRVSCRLNKLSR